MSQTVVTCPRCNKKNREQELKPDEYIKLYCDTCKKHFWLFAELRIKKLIEHEEKEE